MAGPAEVVKVSGDVAVVPVGAAHDLAGAADGATRAAGGFPGSVGEPAAAAGGPVDAATVVVRPAWEAVGAAGCSADVAVTVVLAVDGSCSGVDCLPAACVGCSGRAN